MSIGYASTKIGNLEVAEKYYLEGLALDPKHIGINEYLGEINNLTLLASENTINLSWDSPNDAETFKIYKDGNFLIETSEQTLEEIVDPGVEYCYAVSAVNIVNLEGPQSSEECETSLYPPSPTLSLSVDGSLANLTWTSVSTADSYRLYQDNIFQMVLIYTH